MSSIRPLIKELVQIYFSATFNIFPRGLIEGLEFCFKDVFLNDILINEANGLNIFLTKLILMQVN